MESCLSEGEPQYYYKKYKVLVTEPHFDNIFTLKIFHENIESYIAINDLKITMFHGDEDTW